VEECLGRSSWPVWDPGSVTKEINCCASARRPTGSLGSAAGENSGTDVPLDIDI